MTGEIIQLYIQALVHGPTIISKMHESGACQIYRMYPRYANWQPTSQIVPVKMMLLRPIDD